ncbi:MAG TPA: aspartate--tRNA ligase [Bacteroidales bacterium]|nr:aspartate--tRNA ligase [Bacteroidales bacterium]
MYRTHTCGELRQAHINQTVTLSGWVQRTRDLGGMSFVDLRDRYGITQLAFNNETNADLYEQSRKLGREFVIQTTGKVVERYSKNLTIPTGEIEILVETITILSKSETPPFTIEDETDGGEELRLKYRYIDLRRNAARKHLEVRHKMAQEVRRYLDDLNFLEVETPVLIKSTPEGARDFVVPSRLHKGTFYALPQSPQVFKQLLMVSGFDRYFQIVKCFRDEDFRSDRQPEFTQIDCEMAFVEQEDILKTFEGLAKHLFKKLKDIDYTEPYPRMTFAEAMENYGNDRPDIRFEMKIKNITELTRGADFKVFDEAEFVGGICVEGAWEYTRKQLDALTEYVKRPQIGAKGLVYVRFGTDGSLKSSVDKFYNEEKLKTWAAAFGAKPGDLMLILSGTKKATLPQLSELRLEMGKQLGFRKGDTFAPLWVLDFPLLEWNEESHRYHAMHHPFTSPKIEDIGKMYTAPGEVRANAYDLVVNGSEVGGGSIRIFDSNLQKQMFDLLGFTPEEAEKQFGFLINAFRYGAPPHGGIALGFDRLVSIFNNTDSIRDVIAFPKNNGGRDIMIETPSEIAEDQLKELHLLIRN